MIIDHPIVFGTGGGLFGVLTLPQGETRRRGVVICSPFGHPNICSYRPLRTLARRIAERGWPVMRFDWPGSGDSGDPDGARESPMSEWTRAVAQAVETVRSRVEVDEVSLVGLRIGATLAVVAAADEPAVTGIGLLAPFASGRAYLREARAFQALAESQFSEAEGVPPPLPEGSMESSGFLVSREEIAALESLDLAARDLSPFSSHRVLIVTPQPERNADALAERLVAAGASVTSEVAGELVHAWAGTATSVMPGSCSALVCAWLAAAESSPMMRRADIGRPPAASDPGGCHEQVVVLDTPRGRLFGIVCEPEHAGRRSREWIVFLNSGKVRRVGPNRLVTTYARTWAQLGVPSLRLDLHGIGDSDGDPSEDETPSDYEEAWYYQPSFVADVGEALDWLASNRGAQRFALVGLCSGATWGFQAAIADERIAGVALVNPRVLFEDRRSAALQAWEEAHRIARSPRSWREVRVRGLRGHGLRSRTVAAARGAVLTLVGRGDQAWQRERILDALAQLNSRATLLSIIFSDGDLGLDYFERQLGPEYRAELGRFGMTAEIIHGPDHTFRPLWSHPVLRRSLETHLRLIGFLEAGELNAA
jgi:pimeloyl-ACP methyl ester carboxylesterase